MRVVSRCLISGFDVDVDVDVEGLFEGLFEYCFWTRVVSRCSISEVLR
jgi:hypothetical protein